MKTLALITALFTSTPSPIIIDSDDGGYVQDYLYRYDRFNEQKTPIQLIGQCWSACTYIVRVKTACAGPQAMLHFHAAHKPDDATVEVDYYNQFYPQKVWKIIERNGGLKLDSWIHIKADTVMRPCKQGTN